MRTKDAALCALLLSVILLALPEICSAQEPCRLKLSPSALQAARLIGIEPLLTRLSSLRSAKDPAVPGMSQEELSLHQHIAEAVVVVSVDVDLVVDQIDNERAQIVELQSILLERRQRAIGPTNLATLALSTGLGAVSGVLQFSDTTQGAGNAIGFAAGGLSTLLSVSWHAAAAQRKPPRRILPSMLGPLLNESPEHGNYPADIWAYLNSAPGGAPSERSTREHMLAEWRRASRFPPPLFILIAAGAVDRGRESFHNMGGR